MKIGDIAYIIENKTIKEVEILKTTIDFVTVRYKTYLPGRFGQTFQSNGGFRLRKSRVFLTKEEAEKNIKDLLPQ